MTTVTKKMTKTKLTRNNNDKDHNDKNESNTNKTKPMNCNKIIYINGQKRWRKEEEMLKEKEAERVVEVIQGKKEKNSFMLTLGRP